MFGVWELFLPVLLVVVTALLLAMPRPPGQPAGQAERAVGRVRLVGLVLGVAAAAWVLLEPTPLDQGLGSGAVVAPIVFGLVVLTAALCGEFLVRPRWADGPRTASLVRRRVVDHVPIRLVRLLAALLVGAVLLCAYTWFTASPDDLGRAGRSLTAACSADTSSSRGPYPGSFYVWPYLVGVLLAVVLGAMACVRITRRSLAGDEAEAERYRRVGTTSVVSAVGLVVATPLVGIAFFAGTTLLGHNCPQTGWRAAGAASLVLVVVALGSGLVFLVGLLSPGSVAADPRNRRIRA